VTLEISVYVRISFVSSSWYTNESSVKVFIPSTNWQEKKKVGYDVRTSNFFLV
jgi:hypothetical protein